MFQQFNPLIRLPRLLAGAMLFLIAGAAPLAAEETDVLLPANTGKDAVLENDEGTASTVEPSGEGFRIHSDFSAGGDWTQYRLRIPPFGGPLRAIKLTAKGSGVKLLIGVRSDDKGPVISYKVPALADMADQPQTYELDAGKNRGGNAELQFPIVGIVIFVKKQGGDTADVEITKLSLCTGD
jgi:hypothetical protein